MKKKFNLIIIIIAFSMVLASCGKKEKVNSNNNTLDVTTEVSTQEDIKLLDVPSGFTKKYEKAEYEKFDSHAYENGLENTLIWFEGVMGDINTAEVDDENGNVIAAVIDDEDGNKWLVSLDMDSVSEIEKYSELKGHNICICGTYQGYSDVYEMPAMFMNSLFDRNDGKLINSKTFGENDNQNEEIGENGKPLTNEFDSATNQKLECFGVHFELPSTWTDKKEEGDNIYFYPPDGMCLISHCEMSIEEDEFDDECVNAFLNGISKKTTDYELLGMKKCKVKNDGRDAYDIKCSYTWEGQKMTPRIFMFLVSDGACLIMYSDYEKSNVDRSKDFAKVIDSISFNEISNDENIDGKTIGESNGITPSFKSTMDKYEKFFDEYVDFMNKYSDSDYSTEMLSDYTKLITTYSEYMTELGKIEDNKQNMSNEDWAYYIEVNARIQKKLLEINQ